MFGVSDDRGKYDDDGGAWFFSELSELGLRANKMTVNWDPARPDVIADQAFSTARCRRRSNRGVPGLVRHPRSARRARSAARRARSTDSSLVAEARVDVSRRHRVRDRERAEPDAVLAAPVRPARPERCPASRFAAFLARSYDALKDVNPNVKVVGVGLSPRGSDRPRAKSNISTSPVRFIQALGIGYRMARNKPIMDVFGFHPYPARDRDPLHRGYRWPNAGVADTDRIKQAVWDAFHDTAQPTFLKACPSPRRPNLRSSRRRRRPSRWTRRRGFRRFQRRRLGSRRAASDRSATQGAAPPVVEPEPEPEPVEPLTFKLDEVEYTARLRSCGRAAAHITGARTCARPTRKRRRGSTASWSGRCVRASVSELLFFGLVDEANLDRWQAALVLRTENARRGGRCGRSRRGERLHASPQRVVPHRARDRRGRRALAQPRCREGRGGRHRDDRRPEHRVRAYRPLRVAVSGRPGVELTAAVNPERSPHSAEQAA